MASHQLRRPQGHGRRDAHAEAGISLPGRSAGKRWGHQHALSGTVTAALVFGGLSADHAGLVGYSQAQATPQTRRSRRRKRSNSTMSESITILGDGAMATVCSVLLSQRGHDVVMWGAFEESIDRLIQNRENRRFLPGVRVPKNVRLTASDIDCFERASLVLSAVPTQYMRDVWQRVGRHLPGGVPIVSVAKGIENNTLLRPTQIIADVLSKKGKIRPDAAPKCDWPLAVLSGPNIAAELARYLPATSVAASEDVSLAQRVQKVFSTEWLRVYTNDDVIG